ncbi:MMPL family transporter [Nakamurella sp. GG22]
MTGAATSAYRAVVVAGRWLIVVGWVALALLLPPAAPSAEGTIGSDVGTLLPADSPAVTAQQRSLEKFAVPLISQVSIVVHDPAGLTLLTQADVALFALSFVKANQEGRTPPGPAQIIGAVPVPGVTPDTAVTYLYTSPGTAPKDTVALANGYAAHFANQASVQTWVTGVLPGQLAQRVYLYSRLDFVEIATLALVALVVAFVFRSFTAPLAVLAVAGLGYVVSLRLLRVLADRLGFPLPDELRPLLAALLIGVVTDYCVLFLFAFRDHLVRGAHRHGAAARAAAAEGPIVAVAGLTVAGGTAALLAASFPIFRAFGPAMAVTVLVGLAVSITLVPALMAIAGRWLFLPWNPTRWAAKLHRRTTRRAGLLVRILVNRAGAAVAALLAIGVLVAAAAPIVTMRLDASFTGPVPRGDPVREGADLLDASGVGGITAPTEILIEGPKVTTQRKALDAMQAAIADWPGVARVLGPAQNPLPDEYGVVLSTDGTAARYIVVFAGDPLGGESIEDLESLSPELPALAAAAGLQDVSISVTGQTAIAAELAAITRQNLLVTLLAAFGIELLILIVYLRAFLAPLLLLACSALGVLAALGLTVLVFQDVGGATGLTFYVVFATSVLLLALGSDYNVFTVGAIWRQAARHPLGRAIARAMPATARAVTAAGLILAATFAMVAIIPLDTFRQLAFTMSIGLLLDTFIIRPVLTPAVLTLLGRSAGWPSRRITTAATSGQDLQKTAQRAALRSGSSPAGVDAGRLPARTQR